jgi:hypothetical protein
MAMVLGRVGPKARAKIAGFTNPLCGSIKATFSAPDLSLSNIEGLVLEASRRSRLRVEYTMAWPVKEVLGFPPEADQVSAHMQISVFSGCFCFS